MIFKLPEHDFECFSESGITYYGNAWLENTVQKLMNDAYKQGLADAAESCHKQAATRTNFDYINGAIDCAVRIGTISGEKHEHS